MQRNSFYISCSLHNNAYHAQSDALDLLECLKYFDQSETITLDDFVFETGHGSTYEYFEEREHKQYTIASFVEYFTLLTEKAPLNEIYVVSLTIRFKNFTISQHEAETVYSVETPLNKELTDYLSYIFNQYKIKEQAALLSQILASDDYFLIDLTGNILHKTPTIAGIWGWH